jgi:L-alanine-DL-glutamate epimerase-like enolase superfamily enzyme
MRLSFRRYDLKLKHRFATSRGSVDLTPIVITEIEHDGITGYGEASPLRRYGESVETVLQFLARIDLSKFDDPFGVEKILLAVDGIAVGNNSAKAAVDIALHDWIGKKLNVPLHRYWKLDNSRPIVSSFTIGIDSLDVIGEKVREAEQYPILKVKLGNEHDKEIINTIRSVTKKTLRVDANEGWKTKEVALERIKWLEQEGVELIEQPMPAANLNDTAWLRERVNVPLIADENSMRLADVATLRNVFDGINVKLMKSTGLHEALRMIQAAKANNLKVMAGCMIESSIAISAAAQLSPLLDYADLDGSVLVTNDPFDGMKLEQGRIVLPNRPGIGAVPRNID